MELKEVVNDILPRVTGETLEFIEYSPTQDAHAAASKEQMHVWLTAFINDVRKVDDFFKEKLAELINEFVEMQEKCLDKTRGMLYVKE